MKWFRHETDAHTNLKLQAVLEMFGLEGIGYYWCCIELVGLQGERCKIDAKKMWKMYLSKFVGVNEDRQDQILTLLADIELIDKKALNKGDLYIPKLAERLDDYTKRVSRLSEYSPNIVPLQDKTVQDKTVHNIPFKTFWDLYPKKVEKKKAENKWDKLGKEIQEVILKDLPKRKESDSWKKGYILNPMTYLNGERWNDQIISDPKPNYQKPDFSTKLELKNFTQERIDEEQRSETQRKLDILKKKNPIKSI